MIEVVLLQHVYVWPAARSGFYSRRRLLLNSGMRTQASWRTQTLFWEARFRVSVRFGVLHGFLCRLLLPVIYHLPPALAEVQIYWLQVLKDPCTP